MFSVGVSFCQRPRSRRNAPRRKWPVLEPELRDGRVEGLVEDELFDELRRLEKRVTLADRLGKVLVQVAQEARILAGEHQRGSTVRIALAEEVEQRPGALARRREHPNRVVLGVEDITRAGEL